MHGRDVMLPSTHSSENPPQAEQIVFWLNPREELFKSRATWGQCCIRLLGKPVGQPASQFDHAVLLQLFPFFSPIPCRCTQLRPLNCTNIQSRSVQNLLLPRRLVCKATQQASVVSVSVWRAALHASSTWNSNSLDRSQKRTKLNK